MKIQADIAFTPDVWTMAVVLVGCSPSVPLPSTETDATTRGGSDDATSLAGTQDTDGESTDEGQSGLTETGSGTGPVTAECGAGVHDGDLVVTDATNPIDVAGVTHVKGSVAIENTSALVDLSLLADLHCVERSLHIVDNGAMESLDGLENLRRVGEEVLVEGNPMLARVDGLNGVRELTGLYLHGNDTLAALPTFPEGIMFRGFDDVASIADLSVRNNHLADLDALLAIPDLTVAAERIRISIDADDTLESTAGLAAFAGTNAEVEIRIGGAGEPALTELDLTGLEEVTALYVGGWPGLAVLTAPDLRRASILSIGGPHGLVDLGGLPALEEVGSLWLGCDDSLEDGGAFETLAGPDALVSVGGLVISSLPDLVTLEGLPTSMAVDSLTIRNNPVLTTEDAEAFADAVAPAEVDICGNAGARPCTGATCLDLE